MKRIVLDTSFLLSCIKFKIDLFSELKRICDFDYAIFILDKTNNELEGKKSEKLALQLIKKFGVGTIKTGSKGSVDELLLKVGVEDRNIIIATQDKALKESLKSNKIPCITIRQKKYLIRV